MKDQKTTEIERLEKIWEDHKDHIRKDEDKKEFIELDNGILENAGIRTGRELQNPNSLHTFSAPGSGRRYSLRGWGGGKSRLFKSW